MLEEVIAALRNVVAPAVSDPYPKTQAYIAAVILEFVSRSLEERSDVAAGKEAALNALFDDLGEFLRGVGLDGEDGTRGEARLARLIERLYAERERMGEDAFEAANRRVRRTLRELLDQDLKIAGGRD